MSNSQSSLQKEDLNWCWSVHSSLIEPIKYAGGLRDVDKSQERGTIEINTVFVIEKIGGGRCTGDDKTMIFCFVSFPGRIVFLF